MSDVVGIELPVDDEIHELAATLDAGVSSSDAVGERLNVMKAAAALRDHAVDEPASVRAVAPTLKRALRVPESRRRDATATDLYVSGIRERQREHVAATLAAVANPSLVRGYEASAYSLQELVAVVGETLTATTADVVCEHYLRTLATVARARPAVARAGLDADAVGVMVEWLHDRESVERWQETAVAELLAVTVLTNPSVFDEAPVAAVTERLLERESATTRALAHLVRLRAPDGVAAPTVDQSGDEAFAPLQWLADGDSIDVRERRGLVRAVGRCVALDPGLVTDAPTALVERVRTAPRGDRGMAATALGEVIAHSVVGANRPGTVLVDRLRAAAADGRDRRVRVVGEAAVACPDRVGWVPTVFRERVAAAAVPAASAVRAVGECVVAATDADRALSELRRRVRSGAGPGGEHAAVVLGEWIAHVPDIVDVPGDSLAAAVRAATGDEREATAAVLGGYTAAAAEGDDVAAVVGRSGSTLRARVRGERVLAGCVDGLGLDPETRRRLRDARGHSRRFATHALGVAVQYRESTGEQPHIALRRAVATSTLEERPTRLRLLGEWTVATQTGERVGGEAGGALADRVRETTGTDREQAARALGLTTMACDDDEAYEGVAAAVVARVAVHDEVAAATRRAVCRARPGGTQTSRASLPYGVPQCDRDWPLRALGELAGVAEHARPSGCLSLVARVAESTGWDRQSAARTLGVTVALDAHGPADVLKWAIGGLATSPASRGARTYTLGEVVAARPAWFPSVPDALVARVRDASGAERTTSARALGEYARQPALDEPGSVRALQAAASDAAGDARDALTRALGEVVVAVPEPGVDVPGLLVDAVADATGQDRRALARLLGELTSNDDPTGVLDRVAPTSADASVFERARRSRMTQGLATIDALDIDDFHAAVSIAPPPDHDDPEATADVAETDVEALLEAPAPIRDPLFDAFTTTLEDRSPTASRNLDGRLDAWLRDATDADPIERLHAVAARSALDTSAASTDP